MPKTTLQAHYSCSTQKNGSKQTNEQTNKKQLISEKWGDFAKWPKMAIFATFKIFSFLKCYMFFKAVSSLQQIYDALLIHKYTSDHHTRCFFYVFETMKFYPKSGHFWPFCLSSLVKMAKTGHHFSQLSSHFFNIRCFLKPLFAYKCMMHFYSINTHQTIIRDVFSVFLTLKNCAEKWAIFDCFT